MCVYLLKVDTWLRRSIQINFECFKTGTAVIAVAIPLSARGGGIHFEFAKECVAEEQAVEYKGDMINGFMIGSQAGLSDVIKNGQVCNSFECFNKGIDLVRFLDIFRSSSLL